MNLNNAKSPASNYPTPAEGMQAGILVQVIGLGLQPQRPYQGQDKPPTKMVQFTYELYNDVHDFGGDQKPLIISETMPFSGNEKSRLYKRVNGIDPGMRKSSGDLSKLVGEPVMIQIVHTPGSGNNAGRVFANIGAVTPAMKGMPVPPSTFNPQFIYDPYNHDEDNFQKLPQFLRDKINQRLDGGSQNANAKADPAPAANPAAPAASDDW